MGQYASGAVDQAAQILIGSFSATGQSSAIALYGAFSVALWGTFSATLQLQKSFDGGNTWIPYGQDQTGSIPSLTAAVAFRALESELGVNYRLACTAFTSGTINYRLSASAPRTSDTSN